MHIKLGHTDGHHGNEKDFHQEIKHSVILTSNCFGTFDSLDDDLFVDFIFYITNHLYTGLKDKKVAENIKY